MAKKKSAKKASAKKATKKASKPTKKASRKAAPKAKPAAAAAPVVAPAGMDVAAQPKPESIEMPSAPAETTPSAEELVNPTPVEKHEDFAQALTEEPPKKGFWARLFGK